MKYNLNMKKLFLLLILSFFSAQSFAGSCPDGSEPTKSLSADGTYFVYNCDSSNESNGSANSSTVSNNDLSVWKENGVSPNVAKQLSSVGANSNANWTDDIAFLSTTVSNDPYKVDQVLDDGWSHYVYIVSIDSFLSKDFKKVGTMGKHWLHEKIKSIGEQISQILIEHPNAVFGISLKGGGNSFYKSPEGITRGYFLTAWEKDLEVRKAFQEVWRLISEDLKHISENNLVFNIMNEPEFEYMKAWNKREIWEEWSTEIVDVIRSVSPDRTLIIEGMHKGLWARYDGPENLLLPIDRTNIVYGFHYYQHAEWAFQDTQGWMQGVSGNPMPYNYEQEVKAHMNQLIRYSEKYNVPVVLSEIGVNGQCDGNGPVPEDRAKYVSVVYDTLIPANIGITWWAIESPPNSPYQRVSGNCYRNIDKKLIPDEALFKALNLI